MKNYKAIQWFLDELPELQRSGVLTPENRQQLELYYRSQIKSARGVQTYLLRGILLIAALMIAGGIILLTAHNWDMLPKAGKLAITFTPFAMASLFGILTLIRGWGQSCREFSALLIAAGIITIAALISQIYHLNGSMFEFLTLILGLTLPLIYIFNSIFYGAIFAIALLFFGISGINIPDRNIPWIPFAYTILWTPFAVWTLRKSQSQGNKNTIQGVSLFAMLGLLAAGHFNGMKISLLLPAAAGFCLLAGLDVWRDRKSLFSNVWLNAGYLTMTVWLLIFSMFSTDRHIPVTELNSPFFWMVWTLFIFGMIFYLIRNHSLMNLLFTLFPLLAFLRLWDSVYPPFLFMGYQILSGYIFCDAGFRKRNLFFLNLGILSIIILLSVHFFDSRYSILMRSAVFITMGVIFLGLNWILGHFFKKGAA